jgi:hypothetical protein
MSKGLLYFAQNPAFQHLTKIGWTTNLEVQNRGLSASNVPEDFNYLAVFECEDAYWAEQEVHNFFDNFRHSTSTGRKTEFFWSGCIKKAIRFASNLKGVKDTTDKETEEVEIITESGEKEVRKSPRTTFEMVGVPVGATILFHNDKALSAVVVDNTNKIKYNGKINAISNIGLDILKEKGVKGSCNGFAHFYYNGEKLFDMRPDQQDKEITNV